MRQRKEQHIDRAVGAEVVQDGVDPHALGGQPAVHALQEIHPVGDGAAGVGHGEGVASGRLEGAEDLAFLAAAVVNLLACPSRRARHWLRRWSRHDQALARPALGGFRPHLVEGHHDTAVRWTDRERF